MSETQGAPAAVAPAGTFTQAQLDAAVTEARTAAEAGLQPKIDAAVTEALNKDRVRVAGLDAMLTQLGNHPKAVEIVNAAKADGSSVDAAKVKLFDAGVLQQAGVLAAMRQDEKTAVGATPAAPGGPAPQAQGEEAWKAEFEGSDKLKAEYGSASAYVAFKKAEQRGRIRLNHGAKAA